VNRFVKKVLNAKATKNRKDREERLKNTPRYLIVRVLINMLLIRKNYYTIWIVNLDIIFAPNGSHWGGL